MFLRRSDRENKDVWGLEGQALCVRAQVRVCVYELASEWKFLHQNQHNEVIKNDRNAPELEETQRAEQDRKSESAAVKD